MGDSFTFAGYVMAGVSLSFYTSDNITLFEVHVLGKLGEQDSR